MNVIRQKTKTWMCCGGMIGVIVFAVLPALGGKVTHTYDACNRLTRVVAADGTVIEYSYDAAGNRIGHTVQPVSAGEIAEAGSTDAAETPSVSTASDREAE